MVAVEIDAPAPTADLGGRARILREARALFTAQGFAAVSMQQIADAAAVNKATLYHHFRDKEDLFVSVMAAEFSRTASGLAAVIAEPGPVRHRLQRVARHMFAVQKSDFGRLSSDLRAHVAPERLAELVEQSVPPWEQIRSVIDDGVRRGEVRAVDTDLVARFFFAMVGSQVWWSKIGAPHTEPDGAVAEVLADVLLDGIGSAQPALQSGTARGKYPRRTQIPKAKAARRRRVIPM